MTFDCLHLESRLERLVAGDLGPSEQAACEEHLAGCEDCALLVELATVPLPASPGTASGTEEAELVTAILAQTTGPVCTRAETLLCALVDGELSSAERPVVDSHLAHCGECSALARAVAALSHDLPRMAEVAPGAGFVEQVMSASLPWEVRTRRWWRSTWPGWVDRPRFAIEMAYALTLVAVLVFNLPGTPLAAMPRQALDLARTSPVEALEEPVRSRFAAWSESDGALALEQKWADANAARERATEVVETSTERVRTFLGGLASLLKNAIEDSPSGQAESTEETS